MGRTAVEVFLLAALTATAAIAQPPENAEHAAWLRDHAAPIRSLDPEDEDFADLEPLARAIAGARVVQLGEGTHGEGSTFLARRAQLEP